MFQKLIRALLDQAGIKIERSSPYPVLDRLDTLFDREAARNEAAHQRRFEIDPLRGPEWLR